jgi:predicted metal-binding membrane protein
VSSSAIRARGPGAITLGPVAPLRPSTSLWVVGLLIVAAWLVAAIAQLTGNAQALHHHALIASGGPPLWLAIPVSLAAWQVMIAAMMLPASLPAVRSIGRSAASAARPTAVVVAFLGAYAAVWTAFGLAAFIGDAGLHLVVHATPWLAEQPQVVAAGVLAIAGAYQFLPLKGRGLAGCRQPDHRVSIDTDESGPSRAALRAGGRHAWDCVTSSAGLMLLMFAAGFANLFWMAALTAVMTYEAIGRHGHHVARAFGSVLLGLAIASTVGWFPVL